MKENKVKSIGKPIHIRDRRAKECFPIINRGKPWYDTLTETQRTELTEWYNAWLNATETLVIPKAPEWLK